MRHSERWGKVRDQYLEFLRETNLADLAGRVPVKLLGIVPAFAYNLALPTVFSLVAMGAFSIAWNLFHGKQANAPFEKEGEDIPLQSTQAHYEVWEEISQDAAPEPDPALAAAPGPNPIPSSGKNTGWSRAWLAGGSAYACSKTRLGSAGGSASAAAIPRRITSAAARRISSTLSSVSTPSRRR